MGKGGVLCSQLHVGQCKQLWWWQSGVNEHICLKTDL